MNEAQQIIMHIKIGEKVFKLKDSTRIKFCA